MSFKSFMNKGLSTASSNQLETELDKRKRQLNPYPLFVFPKAISPFIEALCEELNCDRAFVGGTLLAAYSSLIGTSFQACVSNTWATYLPIWTCNVGMSSSGKTMTQSHILRPLFELQKKMDEEYADLKRQDENSEMPGRTPKKDLIIKNVTFECYTKEILLDNPKGLIKYEDELSAWLGGMDAYKKGEGVENQFWLSSWSNVPYSIRRTGGKVFVIDRTFTSVIGSTQRDVLYKFFDKDRLQTGFTYRLLFNIPEKDEILLTNPYYEFPELALAPFKELMLNTYNALPVRMHDEPKRAYCTKAAVNIFWEWQKRKQQEINLLDEFSDVPKEVHAGIFGKIKEYILRLSLLIKIMHRVADKFDPTSIDSIEDEYMACAVELGNYYYASALEAYRIAMTTQFVPAEVLQVANYLKRFSLRKVSELTKIPYTTLQRKVKKWVKQYPNAFGSKA